MWFRKVAQTSRYCETNSNPTYTLARSRGSIEEGEAVSWRFHACRRMAEQLIRSKMNTRVHTAAQLAAAPVDGRTRDPAAEDEMKVSK